MIISIDEGTTSTRALMISPSGEILGSVQKELEQIYPQPGWVEHNPQEIWDKTLEAVRELVTKLLSEGKINKADIQGIAITNQRETTVIWDPITGNPVYNAIVWQCTRTAERCNELKTDDKFAGYIKARTGLIIDSYFSATKISWILENVVAKNPKLNPEKLMFGTIDTWLIWNLTMGREHLTEPSNASRTMLYDIHQDCWDESILSKLNIPKAILPKVIDSNGDFNSTPLLQDILDREIPIKAVLGDQQAALYAYNNEAKTTYGTGTFILVPDRSIKLKAEPSSAAQSDIAKSREKISREERSEMSFQAETSNQGLVQSTAFKTTDLKALAIEGSIFVGGSIVQWLRDELEFITSSSEIEELAKSVDDNGGVYLIPALVGLGAPYWDGDARGTIFGITRGTNRGHIARAALEAIAYRVRDVFEALDPSIRQNIKHLNVDGGATQNDLLMQFQADLLQLPVKRYTESEMTALGVAKMTGDIELKLEADKVFEPATNLDDQYQEWQKYIKKLIIN